MGTKNQISRDEKVRKAYEWLCLADTNFLVCQTIQKKKDQDGHLKQYDFLVLASNNAFNSAVEILHALVCSKEKQDLHLEDLLVAPTGIEDSDLLQVADVYEKALEAAYPNLEMADLHFLPGTDFNQKIIALNNARHAKYRSDGLSDLQVIRDRLENGKFHLARHQSVAHKNPATLYPSGAANLLLFPEVLEEFGQIVKLLRVKFRVWFDWTPENHILSPVMHGLVRLMEVE